MLEEQTVSSVAKSGKQKRKSSEYKDFSPEEEENLPPTVVATKKTKTKPKSPPTNGAAMIIKMTRLRGGRNT